MAQEGYSELLGGNEIGNQAIDLKDMNLHLNGLNRF